MFSKRLVHWLALLLAMVVMAACQPVSAQPKQESKYGVAPMQFEIAEDGNRFVFSKERVFDDGMPQYGTPFITQGYIYVTGTISGTNGVLDDGKPEFPDKVIGEWTC